MKMNRIVLVLMLSLLLGCSESIDIRLDPEVEVFLGEDNESTLKLTSGDKAWRVLEHWLQEHRSGWYTTNGRYPGGLYLTSGGRGIQVTDTHVVLYANIHAKPVARYIQKIEGDELAGFMDIARR